MGPTIEPIKILDGSDNSVTTTMTALLISSLSHHPVLYDNVHNYHKDSDLKDDVCRSIARHLGYQESE